MARTRRSRQAAEHSEERRRRRRPLRSRRSATVAVGKSRFTLLREHAFTRMPQGNILAMYQVMVENIFKERARHDGRRCALERREIQELILSQVMELKQEFHSQTEVQRLTAWAVRELKREGRLRQAGAGRLRLARRAARPLSVSGDAGSSDAEADEAEERRLAWQQKKDKYRARVRLVERYRRRQRHGPQSSSSEVLSATPEQSLPASPSEHSLATAASALSLPTDH